MSNVVRVALPEYDAFTETNIDNFSLYSDVDNILIKRFEKGTGSVAGGGSPNTNTISHDLGYIPFFMVYADIFNNDKYYIINNHYGLFEVPPFICASTTSDLLIKNFQADSVNYGYDIFYDDMDTTGTPSITDSNSVFKVLRPNKDSTSRNPNDYIMHSDLNNFKILKHGTSSTTILGWPAINSISHGASIDSPYKYFLFIKFADGKTALVGGTSSIIPYSGSTSQVGCYADDTKIYITTDSNLSVDVSYFVYGAGKNSTVTNSNNIIACAESGKNVLTATNPDDFNFHSDYPTLKYFKSGLYTMTVSDTTTHTIAHNLGYTPFFIGFVNDFEGSFFASESYTILPYWLSRSFVFSPDNDIAAFIYADSTNIYLKAYYQTNAVGTSKTFKFQYKIFKNNLGI